MLSAEEANAVLALLALFALVVAIGSALADLARRDLGPR